MPTGRGAWLHNVVTCVGGGDASVCNICLQHCSQNTALRMAMGDYCSLLHSHVTARGGSQLHTLHPPELGSPASRKTWRAGFALRSITQLDPSLWSPGDHSLANWRHTLHLWSDGFTLEDGPLHSFASPFLALQRAPRHGAAGAAPPTFPPSALCGCVAASRAPVSSRRSPSHDAR